MENDITLLLFSAISIGFIHTLIGPDHYLPFIVLAKARRWSIRKTLFITIASGTGHVLGSVVLGAIGIGLGLAVGKMEDLEAVRGTWAAWALIIFGVLYFIWGLYEAVKSNGHKHRHFHADGTLHEHHHVHENDHGHYHDEGKKALTPWVIFIIFVFGPCEALIPLLMYPAATASIPGLLLVTGAFGVATVATMTGIVLLSLYGLNFLPMGAMERYSHAIAGFIIAASGLSIQILGL